VSISEEVFKKMVVKSTKARFYAKISKGKLTEKREINNVLKKR